MEITPILPWIAAPMNTNAKAIIAIRPANRIVLGMKSLLSGLMGPGGRIEPPEPPAISPPAPAARLGASALRKVALFLPGRSAPLAGFNSPMMHTWKFSWCPGGELNPHGLFSLGIFSPVRLPVPPPGRTPQTYHQKRPHAPGHSLEVEGYRL